jgi:hypothetical protein
MCEANIKIAKMTDFSKAVIYNISCKDKSVLEIYIGSTHDKNHREECHKSVCNNEKGERYNLKVYEFIRDNGGWDNWIFEVIESFPCDNKIELRIREQYHYDLLNPALNMVRPYVSEEEHKEQMAKYYEEHIEEIKDYKAKYCQDNIEEIKIDKAKYYEDNRDELIEKSKKYNQENRDEILKRNNQKITCECGKEYTFGNKKRHCDSKRHKKFIENQNQTM